MLKSSICLSILVVWLIIGFSIDEILILTGSDTYDYTVSGIGVKYSIDAELIYKAESYEITTHDKYVQKYIVGKDTVKNTGKDDDTYKQGYKDICNGNTLISLFSDYSNLLKEECKALRSMRNNGDRFTVVLSLAVLC